MFYPATRHTRTTFHAALVAFVLCAPPFLESCDDRVSGDADGWFHKAQETDAADGEHDANQPGGDVRNPPTDARGNGDAANSADSADRLDTGPTDPWLRGNTNHCSGTVEHQNQAGFEPPDRSGVQYEPATRQSLEEEYGDSFPGHVWRVRPSPELKPRPDFPFHLFSKPGKDVTLEMAVGFHEKLRLPDHFLTAVVMVDYQKVEDAEFRLYKEGGEEVEMRKSGAGWRVPVTSTVERIGITIPGGHFDEKRSYEISAAFYSATSLRNSGLAGNFAVRYQLHTEKISRSTHPCFEPRLSASPTALEKALYRDPYDLPGPRSGILLVPTGVESENAVRLYPKTYEASPGQTVNLRLSYENIAPRSGEHQLVTVPLLDGQPIQSPWWHQIDGTSGPGRPSDLKIDARKQFSVTLPDKPGIYHVSAVSWENPYKWPRKPDGTILDKLSHVSMDPFISNIVRFEVTEASTDSE